MRAALLLLVLGLAGCSYGARANLPYDIQDAAIQQAITDGVPKLVDLLD